MRFIESEGRDRSTASAQTWPPHANEMAVLIRGHAWDATPLGPIAGWPQSLRTAVDLILDAPLGMILLWGPDFVQIYNDGYRALMGAKHPQGLGQANRACWPEVWAFNEPIFTAVMAGESRAFSNQPLTLRRFGRDEEAWFDLNFSPARNEAGAVAGILVTVVETTDRVLAGQRLQQSQERLAAALKAGDLGVHDARPGTDEIFWDDTLRAMWALGPDEPVTYERFLQGVHPDDRDGVEQAMKAALDPSGDGVYFAEYRVLASPDEAPRWVQADGEVHFERGEPMRLIGTVSDITERKRAEAQRELLVDELNHRVKNTLAVVQALARQSLKTLPPGPFAAFEGRLQALSEAHDLLTQRNWDRTDLQDLAQAAAAATGSAPDRFQLSGPPVSLSPNQAVSLAMALHELSTNALKYGALSDERGRVTLRWWIDAGVLHLVWQEIGGPAVVPPQHRGFGTLMVEQSLAADLDGEVQLDFRPEGLRCALRAPLPCRAPGPAS